MLPLQVVGQSELHFVRCIKPNRDKAKHTFDEQLVVMQMRCSGIFEAVRVIGMGFPDRLPHSTFLSQFWMLVPEEEEEAEDVSATEGERSSREEVPKPPKTRAEEVRRVLLALGTAENEYAIGHSKIFLKTGVLSRLKVLKIEYTVSCAVFVQSVVRGRKARRLRQTLREHKEQAELAAQRELEMQAAAEAVRGN